MSALRNILARIKTFFSKKNSEPAAPVDISYSRLQTYLRCPWMYHLVYSLGWRAGPNAGMALGMSLHRTLAAYHDPSNQEKTLDRLWQFYDESWVNEGFKGTQETLDTYDHGRKMLEQFFLSDQKRIGDVVGTEKEFDVVLDNRVRFHGTINRLDRHPDGSYEIVEYKTHGQHWNGTRMETDLQMTLYEMGMRKTLGNAPIKLKYQFLSSDEAVSVHRTANQRNAAETLMHTIADRIRQGDFKPNHEYCPKCEFGNRCSNFKKL